MTIKITIDLKGFEEALLDSFAEVVEEKMTDIYVDLVSSPPEGTPVDTGQARNGWQLDTSVPLQPTISNSVPYINQLNEGHSKQSPAGFIEKVIDKHTR